MATISPSHLRLTGQPLTDRFLAIADSEQTGRLCVTFRVPTGHEFAITHHPGCSPVLLVVDERKRTRELIYKGGIGSFIDEEFIIHQELLERAEDRLRAKLFITSGEFDLKPQYWRIDANGSIKPVDVSSMDESSKQTLIRLSQANNAFDTNIGRAIKAKALKQQYGHLYKDWF